MPSPTEGLLLYFLGLPITYCWRTGFVSPLTDLACAIIAFLLWVATF
jgi:hypothetical protein